MSRYLRWSIDLWDTLKREARHVTRWCRINIVCTIEENTDRENAHEGYSRYKIEFLKHRCRYEEDESEKKVAPLCSHNDSAIFKWVPRSGSDQCTCPNTKSVFVLENLIAELSLSHHDLISLKFLFASISKASPCLNWLYCTAPLPNRLRFLTTKCLMKYLLLSTALR